MIVSAYIIEPLEVLDFHNFLVGGHTILMDSGGLQKEASSLGNPVLFMRDTVERIEGDRGRCSETSQPKCTCAV